jgi:hypothetical protein
MKIGFWSLVFDMEKDVLLHVANSYQFSPFTPASDFLAGFERS